MENYKMKNYIKESNYNLVIMNKSNLKKLSKSQLIELLIEKQNQFQNLVLNPKKPVAAPRGSVKQMVNDYEENIIEPHVAAPRTKVIELPIRTILKVEKPIPKPRTIKPPVPAPRAQIKQLQPSLRGSAKTFKVGIKFKHDPLAQLNNTALLIENCLKQILKENK